MKKPYLNEFQRFCVSEGGLPASNFVLELAVKKVKRYISKTKAFQLLERLLSRKTK